MSKFLLVDGNSLVHRAFHALPLLQNSSGEFTNAVYGFVMMFQRALKELEPTHGAVAFDVSKQTFRSEIYENYKANRKETPHELRGQFSYIKELIKAFGFSVVGAEGFEADDIIGTLATNAAQAGHDVFILTGDRDAFQLISEKITVVLTRKGISETEFFDSSLLYEKYGLTAKQIIDLKALMGDASDNIPGIPGVGEKTAIKLLLEFGTLDNIYENVSSIKGKLADKLKDNKELAYISRDLATINISMNLTLCPEDCLLSSSDSNALRKLYEHLGFKTLLKDLPKETQERVEAAEHDYEICNLQEVSELRHILQLTDPIIYITYQGAPLEALPKDIFFATTEKIHILNWGTLDATWLDELNQYFNSEKGKVFYDLKAAFLILGNSGITVQGPCQDISLMAYLLSPGTGKYTPQDIALDILKVSLDKEDNVQAAHALAAAYPLLQRRIADSNLKELYENIELPLVRVIVGMERTGILLDKDELKSLDMVISTEIDNLKSIIFTLSEEEFNLNSPKQLGKILFEKLNLPVIKKTKTGYSTDAEVLEELAALHEVVAKILDYRTLAKLKSTYIEGLQNVVNPRTGRLHTSFNQTITATGRLSSTEPNLQNIPIRVEMGRQIRKSFVAPENKILLAADYSQIELRILAHLSKDENLMDAFIKGQDIHTRTAQEVFGVTEEEVTSEMRRRAKAVNFGIVYGISDYGLSRDLRIPRREAKTYIENYFNRYKGVKNYLEDTITKARQDGYVSTIFNRRRYLPDLYSSNKNVRNFGERTAMNTPIQGSAADIIKVAMIKIDEALGQQSLTAKMLLQVHDELIFEVPVKELSNVADIVKDLMENTCHLLVPLVADLKIGKSWYDMMHYTGGEIDA